MLIEELVTILKSLNSDGYYIHGNIPEKKLYNAISHFPIDPDDIVLALIDCTLMGSAKRGVAIGLNGIYWKNTWQKITEKNSISWDELTEKQLITKQSDSVIIFEQGCACDTTGSAIKTDRIINLFNQIIAFFKGIKYGNNFKEHFSEPEIAEENISDKISIKRYIVIRCAVCTAKIKIPLPPPKNTGVCTKCRSRFQIETDVHGEVTMLTHLDANVDNSQDATRIIDALKLLEPQFALKSARREAIKQYHPDKTSHLGKDLKELAERKTKEINNAYDYLCKLGLAE